MITLEEATSHQPRAAAELKAALGQGPSHAYLFQGPSGSGKSKAARAFAAEILTTGSDDPEDSRRRALLEPSPHPDLVWLAPKGMSHAVQEIRERVIHQAPLSPFEGTSRVFVIEAAEALNEESQNAMLKTLEEPPPHAHLILLSSESEGVLPTIASRCQLIEFGSLSPEVIEEELDGLATPETLHSAAKLAAGDLDRARFLAGKRGGELRVSIERLMTCALEDDFTASPWLELLSQAKSAGEHSGELVQAEFDEEKEEGIKHTKTEMEEAVRRAQRKTRTGMLDLGLHLAAAWARDWATVIAGAPILAFNQDRLEVLEAQAEGIELGQAREAVSRIQETRRSFELNVSEELALEALAFRLEKTLRD
ncbi:MAG TPA: DNA polymerase III subunit [Solirubrobacterales bacterium]|nr:DNA polymerase III subunit [Solirubrobacterales bacterium]